MKVWLALAWLLITASMVEAQVPVVPGGFGYGMETRAAYGCGTDPSIVKVTSLADDGSGGTTLREALAVAGPKVIVFEVSGYITLNTYLEVIEPCVTIAGHTAPSPGITLRWVEGYPGSDNGFFIDTHDVLVQHLRIRPGLSCNNALGIFEYVSGVAPYNVVIDHVSLGWHQDEGISIGTGGGAAAHDITIWRSIIAEALYFAPGSGGCPGGGADAGHGIAISNDPDIAILQNLLAHNYKRNPEMGASAAPYIANNLIYNPNETTLARGPGIISSAMIGNYIKRGPHARQDYYFMVRDLSVGAEAYLSDNTIDDGGLTPAIIPFIIVADEGIDPRVGSSPITAPTGYTPMSSAATYTSVLLNAGARPANRDAVDTRIVAEVQARTGDNVGEPADVGGHPSLAENTQTFTAVGSPHVVAGNGYTNLENQLNAIKAIVEGEDEPPIIDVPDAEGGVIVSATFTGTAGTNLTAYTGEIGATFTIQAGDPGSGVMLLSDANRARANVSDDYRGLTASGLPISDECDVEADFRIFSIIPGNFYSLWGRMSTTEFTGDLVSYDTSAGTFALSYYLDGAPTTLELTPFTLTVGLTYRVRLLIRDDSLSVKIDDVPILYSASAPVAGSCRAGLSVYATTSDTNSTGIHFDNLLVTDIVDEGEEAPEVKHRRPRFVSP